MSEDRCPEFTILGKRREIGEPTRQAERRKPPSQARRPRASCCPGEQASSSSYRDAKQGAISAQPYRWLSLSASSAPPAFLLIASGREERVDERALVVGRNEPTGASSGRVVERVDVDPGERARRVGRLPRLSEGATASVSREPA